MTWITSCWPLSKVRQRIGLAKSNLAICCSRPATEVNIVPRPDHLRPAHRATALEDKPLADAVHIHVQASSTAVLDTPPAIRDLTLFHGERSRRLPEEFGRYSWEADQMV